MSHQQPALCYCGSGLQFTQCCAPLIDGKALAASPEALMRSRYSAFCQDARDYLLATWHSETRPQLEAELGRWVRLEIIAADVDEDEGEVEFKAFLIQGDKLEILHERSDFVKINDRWYYHSGEFLNEGQQPQKISAKMPCPCGSGQIFKFCHRTR